MNRGHFVDAILLVPHWTVCHLLTFDHHGFNIYLGWWSCAQDLLFWPLYFVYLFSKTYNLYTFYHERGHFVDVITHWTLWHCPSVKVSTVCSDDEVVHKTYCFDLDLLRPFFSRSQNIFHIVIRTGVTWLGWCSCTQDLLFRPWSFMSRPVWPAGHYLYGLSVHHILGVPLCVQRPAKAMPFQQIIM